MDTGDGERWICAKLHLRQKRGSIRKITLQVNDMRVFYFHLAKKVNEFLPPDPCQRQIS